RSGRRGPRAEEPGRDTLNFSAAAIDERTQFVTRHFDIESWLERYDLGIAARLEPEPAGRVRPGQLHRRPPLRVRVDSIGRDCIAESDRHVCAMSVANRNLDSFDESTVRAPHDEPGARSG